VSYDGLANVAWALAIATAFWWWTVFSSLKASRTAEIRAEIQSKWKKTVSAFASKEEATELTEKWLRRLEEIGLALVLVPSPEDKLSAWRWFLAGLLPTSQILLLPSLIMSALPDPTISQTAIQALGKWFCIFSILSSALIFLISLLVLIRFGGMDALRQMAFPTREE
jgi:hypothetical protein